MTSKRARAIIDQIRYRQGWTIRTTDEAFPPEYSYVDDDEAVRVFIESTVPDAYTPGATVTIVACRVIFIKGLGEPDVLRLIFDFLLSIERHEAGEFFQYNGTRPFNPHATER